MIGLHDRHHHLTRPFPPLAGHRDGEGTTTQTPAMAGLQEFESLLNTNAQRSLILLPGRKRRAKRLPRTVPYKYPTKQPSLRGAKKRKRRGGEERKKEKRKNRENKREREREREREQHKDKRRRNRGEEKAEGGTPVRQKRASPTSSPSAAAGKPSSPSLFCKFN
ncbi:hypothetical protein BDE02_06G011600 [Populus trichocarpa]|nr:hypothetical protein BDE02_06G011600 [Populus trichocarpa]